jgi:hypothetical protein
MKSGEKHTAQDGVVATIIFGLEASIRYNQTHYGCLEETIIMPLVVTEQGTIRIKRSRVSLDSIIHHFKLGATAEQIVQSFPSLSASATFTRVLPTTLHIARKLRCIWNSKK